MALLKFPNKSIVNNAPTTYLANDYLSTGITSIVVQNASSGSGYAFVAIESIANEKWEIIPVTSISTNTITLTTATVYTHQAGTVVYFLQQNQIEFSRSTTVGGAKTVLATKNISGSDEYTVYDDTANLTGYAYTRLKNSVAATFGAYSSAIPYSYSRKSARELKTMALLELNEENSPQITDEFVFRMLNKGESEVVSMRKKGKWAWLRTHNYAIGTMAQGGWRLALPADIQDKETDESIEEVKFGVGTNLQYKGLQDWNNMIRGIAYTELTVNMSIGATTINGIIFANFDTSGTVKIGSNTITYTGKTGTTLTGCTGVTVAVDAGATIFQGASFGTPNSYTIQDGYIYMYPIVGTQLAGKAVTVTYYHKPGNISTGYDEVSAPDETALVDYLVWKIDARLNAGGTATGQAAYQAFLVKADRMRRQETSGRITVLKPNITKYNRVLTFEEVY
jgi:hypothetical protein